MNKYLALCCSIAAAIILSPSMLHAEYTHSINNQANADIEVIFTYQKPDGYRKRGCPRASYTVARRSTFTIPSPCRLKMIEVRCRGRKTIRLDAQDDTESYKRYIQAPPWSDTIGTGWIYRHTPQGQELVQEFGTQIMPLED